MLTPKPWWVFFFILDDMETEFYDFEEVFAEDGEVEEYFAYDTLVVWVYWSV